MAPASLWSTAHDAITHAPRTNVVSPLRWDPPRHALNRFSFGPTPGSLDVAIHSGVETWWSQQIALGRRAPLYAALPAVAGMTPLLAKSPAAVRAELKANGNEFDWTAMDQLTWASLALRTWSPAQVYETVVDAFGDHLYVTNHNGDLWNTRHTMDLDVIRRHAFGTFSDMLLASAKNPAMLLYLNNAESNKAALNENYGRELLELHTIGLGYTEADVQNSARILSGRTVDDQTQAYRYDASQHWVGPVKVQGFSHGNATAAAGEAVGDAYLRYLALHPATATAVARMLCVRFVSDAPSADLVTAVAGVYLASGSAIIPTITAIWHSEEFWSARGAKVRRPAENIIATIRLLGIQPGADLAKAAQTLYWMTNSVGNTPLEWQAPNGYPDVAAAWRSSGSLLTLWGLHEGFVDSWWPEVGASPSPTSLYGTTAPATTGQAIDALTNRLVGHRFTVSHRQALVTFLGESEATPLSNSALRWNLVPLIALILDAPHHALR